MIEINSFRSLILKEIYTNTMFVNRKIKKIEYTYKIVVFKGKEIAWF